ncbi:RNA polymerase sigma-70 factor (ECF subfamily) [Sphingobacterium allocomposti]|uniref:RNA polymerase sigma-70 factor (ECF subfamily) n=2 Tax=Sphingobacterium allocomposti TaxID=415956 RepID=A0A5S5DQ03_9SPHI|nr:RNA polymerase sigma-70 factor (ECF subfamily) [Sphingobacterium composti Yoo et al. 2007 non Ten et al. 2007]
MTAVLCRHFGLHHMDIAEDIASDTFLKASEHWALNGVPDNPTAWLYTVARNKAKDYFKRTAIFETKVRNEIIPESIENEGEFDYNGRIIADSQLAMIFAVCNPANPSESQICLALQILCGFSVEEIADAFLTKIETIRKRLQRGRKNLRNNSFQITTLNETDIRSRLPIVLRTLYLLFNEGYFSKTSSKQVRIELCSEAMRLTLLLTENTLTNTPQVNALLALMCFQSSRLDARTDIRGEAILFDEQDKSRWDQSLIQRGNYYLVNATDRQEVSKYHLEAGIAYWHTAPADDSKWTHILQLYNQLIVVEYSPITALNRVFAFAKVHGKDKAIVEAEKLGLEQNSYYHALLGYLYAQTAAAKSIAHYEQAIQLTKSPTEKRTWQKEITLLRQDKR